MLSPGLRCWRHRHTVRQGEEKAKGRGKETATTTTTTALQSSMPQLLGLFGGLRDRRMGGGVCGEGKKGASERNRRWGGKAGTTTKRKGNSAAVEADADQAMHAMLNSGGSGRGQAGGGGETAFTRIPREPTWRPRRGWSGRASSRPNPSSSTRNQGSRTSCVPGRQGRPLGESREVKTHCFWFGRAFLNAARRSFISCTDGTRGECMSLWSSRGGQLSSQAGSEADITGEKGGRGNGHALETRADEVVVRVLVEGIKQLEVRLAGLRKGTMPKSALRFPPLGRSVAYLDRDYVRVKALDVLEDQVEVGVACYVTRRERKLRGRGAGTRKG